MPASLADQEAGRQRSCDRTDSEGHQERAADIDEGVGSCAIIGMRDANGLPPVNGSTCNVG